MRIDTQPPPEMPEDDMAAADESRPAGGERPELAAALESLREAVVGRHVDPICQAYVVLRAAGGTTSARELLALATRRLNLPVAKMVISAYSHRQCYMCDDGTLACEWCEGTCRDEDGRPCLQCDGLGLATCSFCGGTGWADRATIPPALARAVAKRQLVHVRADLTELQQRTAKLAADDIDSMPSDRRGALAGQIIRLQARLAELGRCDICDEEHAAHIAGLAKRVGTVLETLRR